MIFTYHFVHLSLSNLCVQSEWSWTKSSYSDKQGAVKVVCILTATETPSPFSQVQVKQHVSHQMSTPEYIPHILSE